MQSTLNALKFSPYAEDRDAQVPNVSKPLNRIRWATQRATGRKGANKRISIFNRHAARQAAQGNKRESTGTNGSANASAIGDPQLEEHDTETLRTIYFNRSLPDSAKDEDGHPLQHFPRNKIRTAKYTPLSFIPKNLWFQFHNIANVYFLFIIILSAFSIFGVTNPGLAAVPLIVIITITAVKDAIEDWRRTVLDNELNNEAVHRLVDWKNVNTADEKVGPWRRFKKANTRAILAIWRAWKGQKEKRQAKKEKGKAYADRALDGPVESGVNPDPRRFSALTAQLDYEEGLADEDGGLELTPVPSPRPGPRTSGEAVVEELSLSNDNTPYDGMNQSLEVPKSKGGPAQVSTKPVQKKFYGNLIDPTKSVPEKARFKRDYWKSVQVGDFVRLYNEEQVPADIVVLSTSDADGQCYIETKNLDGETNLKVRNALHSGRKVKRARDCERTDFVLESEPPHANLYAYSGVVRWQQKDPNNPEAPPREMAEPVGINNLLLRGCALRNTDWIVGVVAFTGEESKIMLNSGITPSKRAMLSKNLNWNVIYNFIILFIICLVTAIVNGVAWAQKDASLSFFDFGGYGSTAAMTGFITFWAAIILFQNLVPISLYISLEIVRTAQAFFIYSDTYMYYERIDYPCTPKSWNISDDLGQIEYIFSDKTGTLTQNVMEFKKCTINGIPYGEAYTEAQAGMQKRAGIDVEKEGARAREQIARDRVQMIKDIRRMHDNPYLNDDELTFVAPDFISDMAGESGEAQQAANEQFMLALALCHTVITERTPGNPPRIEFKAQSPDEAALVATARDIGFTVIGRSNDGIIINYLGEEREYTVLNTLEFNSTRKRMSAIIRMPNGKIVLFCKGADSIIYSRLKRGEQPQLRKATAEHLEMFAREGLRTLCIAQRELDEDEYQSWNVEHELAASAVQDREDKLEIVSDAIERDLTLLGGTAIEDRLQDGVPDAISLLGQAGIKLWVLTGDKVETAINIGFSCNLLDNSMDLILLNSEEESLEKMAEQLDKQLSVFHMTGSDEELKLAKKNHEPPEPTHALVVDGDGLKLALDESLRQKFLLLCKQCKSVLCCRVSPAQKAAVVGMVKNGLDVMTLSIGDGANDVAMIQEAHVGVGIAGEEGRQAVMSADYAIGQFRFLCRLVLVHGRWSYRRLAETIANFFYKNLIWVFALFWYQIYTNFDCSYAFDYSYILLYNLAFTSLPVIFMGILDQDVDDKVSLAVPQLYRRGIERMEWTQTKFWLYMGDGLYQSLIVFFFPYLCFEPATFVTESGQTVSDYKRIGVYILNPAIIIANLYVLMNTYRWDWFMVLITMISILLVFFWTGVYTAFTAGFTFYKAAPEVYGQLSFWCDTLLVCIVALAPRFAAKAYQKMYRPRDIDIVREQIRMGKFDYLKNVDPASVSIAPVGISKLAESTSSSDVSKPAADNNNTRTIGTAYDDMRPLYPPSVAPTSTTHNTRTQNGSDGTEYTGHTERNSLDRAFGPVIPSSTAQPQAMSPQTPTIQTPFETPLSESSRPPFFRKSTDRARPSFDRLRTSMDRTRPSIEASHDFTSASYLARVESSHSDNSGRAGGAGAAEGTQAQYAAGHTQQQRTPTSKRAQDISGTLDDGR